MNNIVILEYENRTEEECEILGVFQVNQNEYIILNPIHTETLYFFRYKRNPQNQSELIQIKDKREFEYIVSEFTKKALSGAKETK